MSRFISPPIDQLDELRQPLTRGERLVLDFFHTHLQLEWEIYLQPHLNGLRPDLVLLHPGVGIAVFEVKDWDLDAMDYWVEARPGKSPILLAGRDGKRFSLQSENPVEKVCRYKQELYELYCPRLNQRAGLAAITAGIIFPFAKDERVMDLLSPCLRYRNMHQHPQYNPLSGADSICTGKIQKVFPESSRRTSSVMNIDLAKDLRNWLVEPDFSSTQRQPLDLDKNQLSFVRSRTTSGYRRIRGPAGSGKSLILAARAAELLGEGKEVLVGPNRVGSCPNCGSLDRNITVYDEFVITDRPSLTTLTQYWERNPILISLVLVVTLTSPVLGLILVGWFGVLVGLVIGALSLGLGFFAVTRVREMREMTHRDGEDGG
jgi:hypothetical protein